MRVRLLRCRQNRTITRVPATLPQLPLALLDDASGTKEDHSNWIYLYLDTPIFSHRQIHIVAIATLTGAAELACGHALLSKVYVPVKSESTEAGCPLWVKPGSPAMAFGCLLLE